jgi:pilus assembly protein CpaF
MDDGFDGGRLGGGLEGFSMLRSAATERVRQALGPKGLTEASPLYLAELANDTLEEMVAQRSDKPSMLEQRQVLQEIVAALRAEKAAAEAAARAEAAGNGAAAPEPGVDPLHDPLNDPLADQEVKNAPEAKNKRTLQVKAQVMPLLMQRIDISVASTLGPEELRNQIAEIVEEIIVDLRIQLNGSELRSIVRLLVDDMVGLGPLEPLLADESVTDIMVNGPHQVYVERKGKVELTDVVFRDDPHVLHVATRIVTEVGRRVDESTPLVDARLKDGSRVNIIIPPLAIDGPTISIRKFSKKEITLDVMARQGNISADAATVLKIAGRSRLNILISGGTGSGKTTLLNAMSRMIDHGERTITIEDAAELQLQQPHVVRLETRPANIEGEGEITMRHLVKNALRMRPDRIILGEIRGEEAIDMLQAMNTGHDGSMGTIHSNTPRDALTRLENMVAMAGFKLPAEAVREQIQSAVHMIIQISRMRDGKRRITQITEITGMEGEVVTTQDLFKFVFDGENSDGSLRGRFECTGLRPNFLPRAEYFGLGARLLEAMGCRGN